MKRYEIITILLAVMSIVSCDKLNETVYSSLVDGNAFSSEENAQAAVNSIYAPMKSTYREPMFYINDISTDAGYKVGNCFEVFNENAIFNDNRTLKAWDGFFQMVARANIAITNISKMDDGMFRKVSKNQLLSEAKFLRAYAYYNLTDIFYRVPLITSGDVEAAAKEPLASLEEIEMVIENDLFDAKDYLPKQYESRGEAGRPTYATVCGYLARLYMRQAGRVRMQGGNDAPYWQYALDEINIILSMEGSYYNLQPTVWDVFDATSEDKIYNDELIWAIRASSSIVSGSWDIGLQFTSWEYDMGWQNMYQPLEFTWKFNKNDDRYKVLQVVEYPDVYSPDGKYYIAPPSIELTGTMTRNHTINGKEYELVYEMEETYTQKYKYMQTGNYIYDCPNNLSLLRLADVILMKAECLNELNGPTQEAIDNINRIRERAFRNSNYNLLLSDFATKDDLRSAICDERMFELNNECLRRPDLIRMGLWKQRIGEYFDTIISRYSWKETNEGKESGYYKGQYVAYPASASLKDLDKRMYMPIPEREVTLNPDLANARDFE